jgi:hypothetical protein
LKLYIGDLAFQLAVQRARIEELESSIPRKDVPLGEPVEIVKDVPVKPGP